MPLSQHPERAPEELWRQGPTYLASDRRLAKYVARPIREFLHIEAGGSLLLLAATIAALLWVNLPFDGWAEAYENFWHTPLSIEVSGFHLEEDLHHWVNDGLMAIFFFVVGLEIKYEIVHGDLRDPKTAAMPIVAAIGGMAVPAGLYFAIAGSGETASGWGIPMATDIAFAVGVLGVLGRRIPSTARLFLLTLAIVDDIGAIIVIAVFYTSDLSLVWLGIAIALLAVMAALRAVRVWSGVVHAVLAVTIWYAMLESGVHATLAGVAVGLLTPAIALLEPRVAKDYAVTALKDRDLDAEEVHRLRFLLEESVPVAERLQSRLHPVSSYVVLPIFALANAGVVLTGGVLGDAVTSTVALAIATGLVIGKPVGIALACFIAVKVGLGRLPAGTTWPQIFGLGSVAGIGFTVSLFIAELSFDSEMLTADAKVGILLASVVSAVIGVVLLLAVTRGAPDEDDVDGAEPAPVPGSGHGQDAPV
ncbi:Na+/H+ antiporter NhaA [Nocardioides sambongensis]|uniref:Na+/H+ antiporter NhaA n=1 Tax=Nocardioides sambongensis TaxID=2589074 RepID=UPI0018C88796|nr:Na+/H+ antiporter NhaA [Nocardioides sambongensis]